MAFISCLLRTQLSLQVGHRYQIRFLIIDQTLAIIFKTTIFNALFKNAQLQWFHSKWFCVCFLRVMLRWKDGI